MQYLKAEKQATQYYFQVVLDENAEIQEVREYIYAINAPEGLTEAEYVESMRTEIPLLVQDELNRIAQVVNPPIPLVGF